MPKDDALGLIFLHCGTGRGGVCPVIGARVLLMLLTIFKSKPGNLDAFLTSIAVGLKVANEEGHPQDIDTLYMTIMKWSTMQPEDIQALFKMVTESV